MCGPAPRSCVVLLRCGLNDINWTVTFSISCVYGGGGREATMTDCTFTSLMAQQSLLNIIPEKNENIHLYKTYTQLSIAALFFNIPKLRTTKMSHSGSVMNHAMLYSFLEILLGIKKTELDTVPNNVDTS